MAAAVALLMLAGCGERSQELSSSSSKPDSKPWQGETTQYTAKGYEKGDKAKWELQIRNRGLSQNEYNRVN